MTLQPLSQNTLPLIPKHVLVPAYDRSALKTGIVHIGVGNFHRVHEAIAIDRCLALEQNGMWGICGVGLHSGDLARAKAAAYRAQDGLYTVTTYSPAGEAHVRVVGAMIDYLYAADDPETVSARLAAPDTRIVSLTITEGGYNIDESTGEFLLDNVDVVHDLSGAPPRTAFGFIVEALARRRAAGQRPFTVLSCDNLRHNGDTIRLAITSFARARDAQLAQWIDAEVDFPNSMVDRIAPQVTPSDRARLNLASGVDDAVPAFCEDFSQWILEDRFRAGRPPIERVGVQFSDDVAGFETVKGRLLNATHMLLSYPALLIGYRYVHEALRDPLLVALLEHFMERDVIPFIAAPVGVSLSDYKNTIIERFRNPAIGDQLLRIAHDGASKLPVFHSATIATLTGLGGDLRREAFLLACFARYFSAVDDLGIGFAVHEPALSEHDLSRMTKRDPSHVLSTPSFRNLELVTNAEFTTWFNRWTESLQTDGTRATLQALLWEP